MNSQKINKPTNQQANKQTINQNKLAETRVEKKKKKKKKKKKIGAPPRPVNAGPHARPFRRNVIVRRSCERFANVRGNTVFARHEKFSLRIRVDVGWGDKTRGMKKTDACMTKGTGHSRRNHWCLNGS